MIVENADGPGPYGAKGCGEGALAAVPSAIVNAPDIKARLLELGVEPEGDSSAEFTAYINAEIVKWKKVIEDAKINKI